MYPDVRTFLVARSAAHGSVSDSVTLRDVTPRILLNPATNTNEPFVVAIELDPPITAPMPAVLRITRAGVPVWETLLQFVPNEAGHGNWPIVPVPALPARFWKAGEPHLIELWHPTARAVMVSRVLGCMYQEGP